MFQRQEFSYITVVCVCGGWALVLGHMTFLFTFNNITLKQFRFTLIETPGGTVELFIIIIIVTTLYSRQVTTSPI